jgi:purine-binding chemotaxis protein CheW
MYATQLDPTEKYCVFRQGHAWFALPAICVLEVAANPGVVSVPGANSALAGLCHLRNEFLAVLDLSSLAGEDGAVQDSQQLLVVHAANGPWAILVDRVEGLEVLDVSISQDIRPVDDWSAAMIGSASLGNQAVRVVEPNRLYRFADNILRNSWSTASHEHREDTPSSLTSPVIAKEFLQEVQR